MCYLKLVEVIRTTVNYPSVAGVCNRNRYVFECSLMSAEKVFLDLAVIEVSTKREVVALAMAW